MVEVVGQGEFAGEDVAPLYHGARLRGFGMDVDASGEALLCLAVFPNQGDVGVGVVAHARFGGVAVLSEAVGGCSGTA